MISSKTASICRFRRPSSAPPPATDLLVNQLPMRGMPARRRQKLPQTEALALGRPVRSPPSRPSRRGGARGRRR